MKLKTLRMVNLRMFILLTEYKNVQAKQATIEIGKKKQVEKNNKTYEL